MTRTGVILIAAAGLVLATAALVGVRAPAKQQAVGPLAPVWADAKWPHPIDQWGTGRAFVCKSADCGAQVDLYLRPKIGFCNCATGVSDDAELERVADTELVSREIRPRGPSRP